MSEFDSVTDPAQLRKLLKTRELRESELKPAQKIALYGKGNPNQILYRKKGDQIVSRSFGPAEKPPKDEGWQDSPLKCGLVKKKPQKREETETVFATLPVGADQGGKSE